MLSDYAIWLVVLYVSPASWTVSTLWTEIRSGLTLVPRSCRAPTGQELERNHYKPLHLCIAIKGLIYMGHISPVIALISMMAWSADGPKAIKWMIAPLCFTSSVQFFAELSSPSVSKTISDPSIWGYTSLITCRYNQSITIGVPRPKDLQDTRKNVRRK